MHDPCANGSCIDRGGHCCFPIAISIAEAKVTSTTKRHLKMSAMKRNISLVFWLQTPARRGARLGTGLGLWENLTFQQPFQAPASPGRAQGIKVVRSCRKPGSSFSAFPPQVSWVQPSQTRGLSKSVLKLHKSIWTQYVSYVGTRL